MKLVLNDLNLINKCTNTIKQRFLITIVHFIFTCILFYSVAIEKLKVH